MSKANSGYLCVVVFALFGASANAAVEWKVNNNLDRDFMLEIKLDEDNTDKYVLKVNQTQTILLEKDPHVFWTSLANVTNQNSQRIKHRPQELIPVAEAGVTLLSQIRSPLDVKRGGEIIFKAMTDYPVSREYNKLVNDLRKSRWLGSFEHSFNRGKGSLNLDGENGTADDRTSLTNVKYVPSDDTVFIVGEWKHRNATGDLILEINTDAPMELKGYFRTGRGRWINGRAAREPPSGLFVVTVTLSSAEIKLPEKTVATVSRGQPLYVHKTEGSWYWVSFPGKKPIGFIKSQYARRH